MTASLGKLKMLCSDVSHMPLHFTFRDSGIPQKHGFELEVDIAEFSLEGRPAVIWSEERERAVSWKLPPVLKGVIEGGVHPAARLAPHQCPDQDYRRFIEHHHWSSFHVHLGNSRRGADFPYNMHISGELRGGTLQAGDRFIYKDGRLMIADDPAIRAIAARYPERPGLEPELWLLDGRGTGG